jgi:dTDP-4-dehydrorhamnose reductase
VTMRIAVIGANGQLGSDVVAAFTEGGDSVSGLTHSDIEVTDFNSISRALGEIQPHVVVNTSAMHHVEKCEQNAEQAFAVNALGARNLAMVAGNLNAALIHVSTDYVFGGAKGSPYVEDDTPLPLNAYGMSKLAGEHFIRSASERHFILRTSGLYGKSPCRAKGGLNFIELMLKLAKERGEVRVVDGEMVSPTSTAELAQQIVQLSRTDCYGLYHATAEGSCSWYEFAHEIFSLTDTPVRLKAAAPSEFPNKVPRPKYSVLENQALKARGLNIFRPWQASLREYLEQRVMASSHRVQGAHTTHFAPHASAR